MVPLSRKFLVKYYKKNAYLEKFWNKYEKIIPKFMKKYSSKKYPFFRIKYLQYYLDCLNFLKFVAFWKSFPSG